MDSLQGVVDENANSSIPMTPEMHGVEMNTLDGGLGMIAGVVNRAQVATFTRVLWRTLRGNMYVRFAEYEPAFPDNMLDPPPPKSVFLVFAKGNHLLEKARKVADSFGANMYACPETISARASTVIEIDSRLADLNSVLARTMEHRRGLLGKIAESLPLWTLLVNKERLVYHTLNQFDSRRMDNYVIGEGWASTSMLSALHLALSVGTEQSRTEIPSSVHVLSTNAMPPTYFQTNKVTKAYQALIDAYGVGSYKEINPTPFAITTFPFLFSVMFGDFGHGIMMTIIAALVVKFEKKLAYLKDDEMLGMFYAGRYIILMMGCFSIYTGLIYNDIFSKTMAIFPTGWDFTPQTPAGDSIGFPNGIIYAVGVDYGWHGADNMLVFLNSYKMKLAIILGVMQMSFGLVLSLFNHIYFKRWESVWFEFIPQFIFLQCIFGYLCVCIIYKWCTSWSPPLAPSLLNMLINMFLSPAKIDLPLYSNQQQVQNALLAIALICIPIMLLVKPFILRAKHNKSAAHTVARGYSSVNMHHDSDQEALEGDEMPHVASEGEGHSHRELMPATSNVALGGAAGAHQEEEVREIVLFCVQTDGRRRF